VTETLRESGFADEVDEAILSFAAEGAAAAAALGLGTLSDFGTIMLERLRAVFAELPAGAPMTLDLFAAMMLLRLLAVVAPVTVELRLRPPASFSFSGLPMMLCRARLAAVCFTSTGLGLI
jgi:hypothetical protein